MRRSAPLIIGSLCGASSRCRSYEHLYPLPAQFMCTLRVCSPEASYRRAEARSNPISNGETTAPLLQQQARQKGIVQLYGGAPKADFAWCDSVESSASVGRVNCIAQCHTSR